MIQFKYHIALAYGEQPVRKVTWRERQTEKQIEEREREYKTVRLIVLYNCCRYWKLSRISFYYCFILYSNYLYNNNCPPMF